MFHTRWRVPMFGPALLLAGLSAPLPAQSDPAELLLRVRDKVLHTVDRLPRYMCTQTVDRAQLEPDRTVFVKDCEDLELSRDTRWKLQNTLSDRLRLDVGVASQREIYSWVGENRFGSGNLFDIVTEGTASTGYFQGFLGSVFRSDNADFSFAGFAEERNRKLMEYHFHVPLESSHYSFRSTGPAITTAYEGSVLADPETAELVRLSVRTSHIPPETGTCEAATTLNYSRVRLNGADFLLPSEARLHIKDLNGQEKDNRTVYSGCHEFLGESSLKFEPPPSAPAPKSPPPVPRSEFTIPAGIKFTLRLAQDIDVRTAAAGDAVRALLTQDLRDSAKIVVVPNQTPVLCRILFIRRFYFAKDIGVVGKLVPAQRVELLMRLENFAMADGNRPVYAATDTPTPARRRPGTLQSRPVPLGLLQSLGHNRWFERFENAGDYFLIKRGLESSWVTVAP